MSFKLSAILVLGLVVGVLGIASAQGDRGARGQGGLQGQFVASGLEVGSPLPDVTIYDADGQPFALRSLQGHYSVLVFGCLT